VRRACERCWSVAMGGRPIPTASGVLFERRVKETAGRGRACLRVWPQLHIGTVIKHSVKKQVTHITRQISHGMLEQANALLKRSQGGTMLNTAIIPRLHGTMRQRLATLTRKCRHAARRLAALHTGMYLLGCSYNFCWPHHELSRTTPAALTGHRSWVACTPAIASGLTDHVWSVFELLSYKVAPPPWAVPKRPRGRPRKVAV